MKSPGKYIDLFRSLGKEWKWLMHYASKYRMQIALYVVIGIVSTVMGLGSAVASKHLIDSVIAHNENLIVRSASLAIGLSVAKAIVGAVVSRITTVVGTKISNEIRENVYEHITFSKWENIRKYHSGDLLNRIEGDVNSVSNSVINYIPGVVTKAAQFIGCLAVVLYYDPVIDRKSVV